MTDATTEFFDKLARRGHEPLLKKVTGTMRFDLAQGTRTDHYFVAVKHGAVARVGRERRGGLRRSRRPERCSTASPAARRT